MTASETDAGRTGLPSAIAAALLLVLALIAGGASREAFIADGALQVLSALVLGWCALDTRPGLSRAGVILLTLAFAGLAVMLLSLAPLPPDLWTQLPGRAAIAANFAALGDTLPWMPLSLAPEETVYGLLKFLPPLAIFVLVARFPLSAISAVAPWALLAACSLSVLLGVAQVVDGRESPLYFHGFTNRGLPVGFMANVNHQAILLLMAMPFAAVLLGRMAVRAELGDRDLGLAIMVGALFCMLGLGVMMAGSVAGYGLLAPALLLAFMTARQREWGPAALVILLGLVLVLGVLAAFVAASPVLENLGVTDWSTASLSRPDTYARTLAAITDTFPAGAGLGAFETLFPAYEDPETVARSFMNHAHNDYLEVVLELGLAGVLLLLALLAWFLVNAIAIWRLEGGDAVRLRRAATAALLIVMVHSLVDYPLRTPAIATLAGLCLAIMAAPSISAQKRRVQAMQAETLDAPAEGRHLVL